MSITNDDIQKALRIKRAVNEYFEKTNESKIEAKELMNLFIDKGIFTKNHQDGFPIRELLRKLDEDHQLQLIPQIYFEQKEKNKNWYFIKSNK